MKDVVGYPILERRRSGQPFPAWVQGIDFSGVQSTAAGNALPNLVTAANGYSLAPGQSMTVTYQLLVDRPLAGGVTAITNNVSVSSSTSDPVAGNNTASESTTVEAPIRRIEVRS